MTRAERRDFARRLVTPNVACTRSQRPVAAGCRLTMTPRLAGTSQRVHHRAMLRSLKELFDRLLPPTPDAPAQDAEHVLQLATAVMLVEVMRADATFDDAERSAVL